MNSVIVHVYNDSTRRVEEEGSEIQDYIRIHNNFKDRLRYLRTCLKNIQKKEMEKDRMR